MKAIILAGGKGTRLRPLTLNTPKPIVPIFNRPFLMYQLDQLRQVPEITEVILSLNYQPRRIEETFGDGEALGVKISYAVEPEPLGTGGAIRFSARHVQDSVIVLNGDVLQQIDLNAVIARHRAAQARATIVLTPVDNPSAYGLVETDAGGNVERFLEKPDQDQITVNTINAGIYVLEPETLSRIPENEPYSIERQYFPSLVANGEPFVAYVSHGYWIDIGTPEKYWQVHRDIMDGRYRAEPFLDRPGGVVDLGAKIEQDVDIQGPCFLDEGVVVRQGARIGPYAVLGKQAQVDEQAQVRDTVAWASTVIGGDAVVEGALIGRNCHIGRRAVVSAGRILGDRTTVTDYSKL
ncbi:MAG: NDP-sugar synthase [Acidobacteria bacterium]|nr:NDP-sugar synthase [Acidobacteriota bacterium]